jgi:hypothetical protein
MIVTSNLIQTPKVVTIDQNRWSRSVKFTGHDLLEWVVTVDQNTHTDSDLLPTCRTKVMEQSPLISENSGYETIQS